MTIDILSFLQQQGKSRRHIIQLLQEWRVYKNDQLLSHRKEAVVHWDTITIEYNDWDEEQRTVGDSDYKDTGTIILYNKPLWCVVSKNDPHNQTVYDLLPEDRKNKYTYIGRLDKDSHGLLVLTDIPAFVSFFSHPRYTHQKTYIIKTTTPLTSQDREKGTKGAIYYDKDTREHITLSWLSCEPYKEEKNTYKVILTSWKKRHIRRLCESLGTSIIDLQRVGFWPRKLKDTIRVWNWEIISLRWEEIESLLKSESSYTQKQI